MNDIVCTDTYFSTVKSIAGYWCAQVFFALVAMFMDTFGMKTESEYISAEQDFMRERGIPHTLRRDNARSQNSADVKALHRDLLIKDEFTEPHHPHQNPAEGRAIRFLKKHIEMLMNKTGSPENLWHLCAKYICHVHNMCANPNNKWKIPNQVCRGDTQDISHMLCFYWYQKVLYLDPTSKFPHTKEKPGYFVGFATNSGDALTFKILMEDKRNVLVRSVVRPYREPRYMNKRV